jgi:hypothetical protein
MPAGRRRRWGSCFRVVSGDEREANPRPSVAETSLIVAIMSLFPPLLWRCFFAASSLFFAGVFWWQAITKS